MAKSKSRRPQKVAPVAPPPPDTLNNRYPQSLMHDLPQSAPGWIKSIPVEEVPPPPKPEHISVPEEIITQAQTESLQFMDPAEFQASRPTKVIELAQHYLNLLKRELKEESTLDPNMLVFKWEMPEAPIDVMVLVLGSVQRCGFKADWDGEHTITVFLPVVPVLGFRTRAQYTSVVRPL